MKLNLDDEECRVFKQILESVEVDTLDAQGVLSTVSLVQYLFDNLDGSDQPFFVLNPPPLDYVRLSNKKWLMFKNKIKALVS